MKPVEIFLKGECGRKRENNRGGKTMKIYFKYMKIPQFILHTTIIC
jgi:uncharacterized protein Veg